MWTLKIEVREKGNLFQERTIKYKVKIYFHSINYYERGKKIFFVSSGIIEGQEEAKKQFFLDLKKDKKMEFLEYTNDFFICTYSEPKTSDRGKAVKIAYNPRLIFLKPTIIYEDGREEWEIGSAVRKDLADFVKHAESLENVESEIHYLKQTKVNNLMVYSILPNLTEKQRHAILLAIKQGYYGYPRKITLDKLAKESKISVSTYQFHLAKAEAKLMPFLAKRL